MTKTKRTQRKFEPSDSLKRFIPPLFDIAKITPPTNWDTSRRNAAYGGRRSGDKQEDQQEGEKHRAAMMR
jgi:hypothetical protein